MRENISDEELYRQAKQIVEAKKGFYIHFSIYVVMSIVMYLIWRFTWTGYPWFIWPIIGWGIGVLFHFLGVFVFSRQFNWEKKSIEKEMERLRRK